jgi:hypothetical protein
VTIYSICFTAKLSADRCFHEKVSSETRLDPNSSNFYNNEMSSVSHPLVKKCLRVKRPPAWEKMTAKALELAIYGHVFFTKHEGPMNGKILLVSRVNQL